jgi:hypothetical protein
VHGIDVPRPRKFHDLADNEIGHWIEFVAREIERVADHAECRAHSPDVAGIYGIVPKRHCVLTQRPTARERLPAQLSTQPIAIGDVQFLQLYEPRQQRERLRRILAIAQKPGGERALACDMSLTHRHVPFGFRQALLERVAVSGRGAHKRDGGVIRIGDGSIESKDRMALSLFCRREHAPLSATDARGVDPWPVIGHRALQSNN